MEGQQIGQYRLLHQIGAGGMGAVWLAEHAMLGRRAAVKLLHKEYSGRAEIVSRFFNEARAATAISDPGIVQIFDFGHHTDGTAYIVMELLDGEGLDKRYRNHGPMRPADALRIIRMVASSLGAAHARGIFHRDLKPENIYLVRDPEVAGGERAKILDFGIAKLQSDSVPGAWRTSTSQVMGTPMYMSPEQCRGAGGVDQRSDIYSLGCMLFVLVAGRPPFWGEGSGDLIAAHLREPAPLASTFNVNVPPEVDALISRCLAKNPDERFANGSELANAISHLIASSSAVASVPVRTPAPETLVPPSSTTLSSSMGAIVVAANTPTPPTQADAAPGKRGRMFASIAGVAVIGSIVAVAVTRHGSEGTPETKVTDRPGTAAATADAMEQPPVAKKQEPDPPPPIDAHVKVETQMRVVAETFVKWAPLHATSGCPTARDLGATTDPWDKQVKITCTDQPANQRIGIISGGPDGELGTRDDIESWTLPTVLSIVGGTRWTAKKPAVRPSRTPTIGKTGGSGSGNAKCNSNIVGDNDCDGLPDER